MMSRRRPLPRCSLAALHTMIPSAAPAEAGRQVEQCLHCLLLFLRSVRPSPWPPRSASRTSLHLRQSIYVYGMYFILPLKLAHDLKTVMVAALGLYLVSIHTLSHHDFRRVASPGPEVDFPQRSIEIERGAGNCRSVATSISL